MSKIQTLTSNLGSGGRIDMDQAFLDGCFCNRRLAAPAPSPASAPAPRSALRSPAAADSPFTVGVRRIWPPRVDRGGVGWGSASAALTGGDGCGEWGWSGVVSGIKK